MTIPLSTLNNAKRSARVGYAAEYLTLPFSSLFSAIAVPHIIPFSGDIFPTHLQPARIGSNAPTAAHTTIHYQSLTTAIPPRANQPQTFRLPSFINHSTRPTCSTRLMIPLLQSFPQASPLLPCMGYASPLYGLSISPVRGFDFPCTDF